MFICSAFNLYIKYKVSEVKITVKSNKLAQEGVVHNSIGNQPIKVITRVLATTRVIVIRIIFTNNRGHFLSGT